MNSLQIPPRIHTILKFFFITLILILTKISYLSVIEHEEYRKEALKPQRQSIANKPPRGAIYDRFGEPLAINRLQFNAAIRYADIKQIPRIKREKDSSGKRIRTFPRKVYIEKLAAFLGEHLDLDPIDIEDQIHGQAALFPHTPVVIKEEIEEPLYYRLKIQEPKWPGIEMQRGMRRVYPKGKVACDVLGYVGAISPTQYRNIVDQIERLARYLQDHNAGEPAILPIGFSSPDEVAQRLRRLQQKAYTINDFVGKMGIEAACDEELRGEVGKKAYEVDIHGNFLRSLPDSKEIAYGKRLHLSLSAQLQEEAERLLASYEHLQDLRDKAGGKIRYHPMERGGAIVVMDPHTGEVLALASHPRFDPNDLIPAQTQKTRSEKANQTIRWLEGEAYIGQIWDGFRPMEREIFKNGGFKTEWIPLTWETYLDLILDKKCSLRRAIDKLNTVGKALDLSRQGLSHEALSSIIHQRDQMLALDLIEMVVPKDLFPPSLEREVSDVSLAQFRTFCATATRYNIALKHLISTLFHKQIFQSWRQKHFKQYLTAKRREERDKKKYARPYVDYLKKVEKEKFEQFWREHKQAIFATFLIGEDLHTKKEDKVPFHSPLMAMRKNTHDPDLESLADFTRSLSEKNRRPYLKTLKGFDDLTSPLRGSYPFLRKEGDHHLQKHLASAFYPYWGFGYGRSQTFREANPMGSIFKLVTSIAALDQTYAQGNSDLNPLTLIDDTHFSKSKSRNQILGYFENGEPIRRFYRGGCLPRGYPNIGKIDLVKALERTSNIYFSILAGDILHSPNALLQTASNWGLGKKTGIDLPGEYGGSLPDDLLHNKTGLYSFAIGQHSLVATPLQTAVLLSAIANGGKILKPQLLRNKEPEIRNEPSLPKTVRTTLLQGMKQVITGEKGTARMGLIRARFHEKKAIDSYRMLAPQMVGKTATAEIFFKQTLDAESSPHLEKHISFGAISFEEGDYERPELVVVIYCRFGSAGKQGAPIAAKLVDKWREIKRANYLTESLENNLPLHHGLDHMSGCVEKIKKQRIDKNFLKSETP